MMSFLPENVTLLAGSLLVLASFFTAALTARMGIGGGLVLLAIMSGVLPPLAVIPVHGLAQLGANASRAALQFSHIRWPIIAWFSLGAVIGVSIASQVVVTLPEWIVRSAIAVFILFTVWGPKPGALLQGKLSFLVTGSISSFLTMFFGATGPFVASMLAATPLSRMQISASHAMSMVIQHSLKILAFGILGFAFAQWAPLIAAILVAGFLGTSLGTSLLKKADDRQFKKGIKVLLTIIAGYLLAASFLAAIKIN